MPLLVAKTARELREKLEELEKYRGRGTELVTVIVPAGYDLNKIITMLIQERSTASNIKSKRTRSNVTTALEKIIQHLQSFRSTPPNGIAVFCGNVGVDRDEWIFESIIPHEPLTVKVYRCDQQFFIEPLKELIKPKEVYGLVVIERREATIGLLKGKRIEVIKNIKSIVPGKFRAGGQSAARFERVREGLARDFYKQVAALVKEQLSSVKGILLGGPGPTKNEFYELLPTEVKQKIIAVVDTGYSDEYGLKELVERAGDVLKETEIMAEKEILREFFAAIAKNQPVAYGVEEVRKKLLEGAVEKLLLSEGLPRELRKSLEEAAAQVNAEVIYISTETDEGKEFLAMGGVGAFLRY